MKFTLALSFVAFVFVAQNSQAADKTYPTQGSLSSPTQFDPNAPTSIDPNCNCYKNQASADVTNPCGDRNSPGYDLCSRPNGAASTKPAKAATGKSVK